MASASTSPDFASYRSRYFDSLCLTLGLTPSSAKYGVDFALVSADGGHVRVFLDYERGLCVFAVGPAVDDKPLCTVEELAERFPRPRLLPHGKIRLDLTEQVSFLEANWAALQTMFSPAQLADTRNWRRAQIAEYLREISGGS